jgi:hypothetical protein
VVVGDMLPCRVVSAEPSNWGSAKVAERLDRASRTLQMAFAAGRSLAGWSKQVLLLGSEEGRAERVKQELRSDDGVSPEQGRLAHRLQAHSLAD